MLLNTKPFLLFINWQKEMFSNHTPALMSSVLEPADLLI